VDRFHTGPLGVAFTSWARVPRRREIARRPGKRQITSIRPRPVDDIADPRHLPRFKFTREIQLQLGEVSEGSPCPYLECSTAAHQIAAVYQSMLPRQPLRSVFADRPGAGKTIMAHLYVSERIMLADAHRCS